MKASKATLTLALTAAIGAAGIAHAAGNPFALNALSQGYMVAAADKAQDGKCGEGKCGGAKKDVKAKDGKCGEGKCGGAKETKAKDGKCGEGKCGGTKK
jgi:uncharacterized low-complexity protein